MGLLDKLKRKTAAAPRVGLVLGGGGARGFVEVGALKAFKECGVSFDICVGTSVGSIVGALYCAGIDPEEIEKTGANLMLSDIHGRILIKPEDPQRIGELVYRLIGDAKIEDLFVKFAAVATDLKTGKQIILDRGSVRDAVSASSAYPIVYSPLKKDGMNLSDGGIVNNLPVDVARMLGAERTVAIDLANRSRGVDGTGVIDMLKGLFGIMCANASIVGRTTADVLVSPDTSEFSAVDKNGYLKMIELGYTATMEKMDDIKALFSGDGKKA